MSRTRVLATAAAAALALAAAGLAACGHDIGDACVVSSDCDPSGTRICDASSAGGYCTVQGCDYDTCPGGSVCISFFTGSFANRPCDPATEDVATDSCSIDEVCPLDGLCAPAAAEVRFCMAPCGGDGDCRSEYECRDVAKMREHGGDPVLAPGATLSDDQAFCAPSPAPST